jgi:MFS family permease
MFSTQLGSTLTGVTLQRRPVAAQLAERMSCHNPQQTSSGDRWFAVWSIAFGSFALVFSEVIPVGLLPHLSQAFRVSIGVAGLTVVIPAVAAAIAAPILTLGSARIERRALLWTLSGLVLTSDVVAVAAPNFEIMLVARALLGVCIGGFWVFGAGAAMSLVRAEARGTAIALVSSGIFVATVAALPTAALIGNLTSWRVAFAILPAWPEPPSFYRWRPYRASGPGYPSIRKRCCGRYSRSVRHELALLPRLPSSSPTSPLTPISTRFYRVGPG